MKILKIKSIIEQPSLLAAMIPIAVPMIKDKTPEVKTNKIVASFLQSLIRHRPIIYNIDVPKSPLIAVFK